MYLSSFKKKSDAKIYIFSGTEVIEGSSVDYDTLVIKILDSDKFTALIEQLSLQQGQALEDKLQQNLQV